MLLGGFKELRRGKRRETSYLKKVHDSHVKDSAEYKPPADWEDVKSSSSSSSSSISSTEESDGSGSECDTSESYDSSSDQ